MSEMYKVKDMCQLWDMQGFFDLCNSTDSIFMTVEFADDDLGIAAEAVFGGRLLKEPQEGKMQFWCDYQVDRELVGMKCFLSKFIPKMICCDLFIARKQHLEISVVSYDSIFQKNIYDRGLKKVMITVFEFDQHPLPFEATEEMAMYVLERNASFVNNSTQRPRST